jgi:D-alanine-D-alanine ligase
MAEKHFVPVIHGATAERPDEIDTLLAAKAVAASLKRLGFKTDIVRLGLDLRPLSRLAAKEPYAVFNLVEALTADVRMASVVPAVLERYGLTYTGASFDALAATVSKLRVKHLLREADLPTPAWSERGDGLDADVPVLIKSVDEHASVGIDAMSVVPGRAATGEILRREAQFGGRFFAERYVCGREFNISLLEGPSGPIVLPMPEIVFEGFEASRPLIVDYEAKWIEDSHPYNNTPRLFGVETREPVLARRLAEVCRAVWRVMGLGGYARVDLRVGEDGEPQVIDINTNPCITPDAGFAAAGLEAGIGYDGLVARIVAAAVARPRRGPLPVGTGADLQPETALAPSTRPTGRA